MGKLLNWAGACVLSATIAAAPLAFAQEQAKTVDSLPSNDDVTFAIATDVVAAGSSAETDARTAPDITQEAVEAAVVAAIENTVKARVAGGVTAAEIDESLTRAQNTPNISVTVASALGIVKSRLASLLENPGAVDGGNRNANLPNAPVAPNAGAGYRTQ